MLINNTSREPIPSKGPFDLHSGSLLRNLGHKIPLFHVTCITSSFRVGRDIASGTVSLHWGDNASERPLGPIPPFSIEETLQGG